jgi:hypothetical protein
MRAWQWLLLLFGIGVLAYVGLVLALVLAGRRGDARALAGFVPDCVVLFRRLIASPIDLVPAGPGAVAGGDPAAGLRPREQYRVAWAP